MASTTGNKESESVGSDQAPSFPVYLIHSSKSLVEIDRLLSDYGEVGFLRIMYNNDGSETDRTIAILPKSSFDDLIKDGYGRRQYGKNFSISSFELKDNNYPGEGRTKTLFVPVPKEFATDDSVVVKTIKDKLDHLAEWSIVDADSWSIKAPLKSRESGGIRGGCFVSFKREVSIHSIAMVRLLLTDTYWPELDETVDRAVFQCTWARDRKERPPRAPRAVKAPAKVPAKGADPSVSEEEKQAAKDAAKRASIQRTINKGKPVAPKSPPKGKGKARPKKAAPAMPAVTQPALKAAASQ